MKKIKKKYSKKTKEQLQSIVNSTEKKLEQLKTISSYFTVAGFLISLFVFQYSSSGKDDFSLHFAITCIVVVLFILIFIFVFAFITTGNFTEQKKVAELELNKREKIVQIRNERLKAKYLSKR